MEKKTCTEKACKRCGWCCTHLGMEVDLTEKEEEDLKKVVFEKSGVIYLRPIKKFFLAVTKEEKEKLEKHAKKLGIKVEILPNKLIYDKNTGKVHIFDYYLNHTECPFYREFECRAYEDRPEACRKFPNIDNSYAKAVAKFVKKNKIDFSGVSYEEAVEKCKSGCKVS
jgi:Fe-S-cluster containining protein